MKNYCILCEGEAIMIIPETKSELCGTCATAYEMGQTDIPTEAIPNNRMLEQLEDQEK